MLEVVKKYDNITEVEYLLIRTDLKTEVFAPYGTKKGDKYGYELMREYNYPLCINAGLFNPIPFTNEPEGIIIVDGEVIQNKQAVKWKDSQPLTIDKNGKLWYADCKADANQLVKNGVVYAVCGFMPIVIDGEIVPKEQWGDVPHFELPHYRQIIGQYSNGDYCVITCDEKMWTIADCQRICIENGLEFAYNLDGGTSTETVVDGVQISQKIERMYDRRVPTFIVFLDQ